MFYIYSSDRPDPGSVRPKPNRTGPNSSANSSAKSLAEPNPLAEPNLTSSWTNLFLYL